MVMGLDTLVNHLNKMEQDYNDDPLHKELEGIDFGRWDWDSFDIINDDKEVDSNGNITKRVTEFQLVLSYYGTKDELGYVPRPWYSKGKGGNIYSVTIPTEKIMITPPPISKLTGREIEPEPRLPPANPYRVYMENGKYVVDTTKPMEEYVFRHGKYVNIGGANGDRNDGSELYRRFGINDDDPFPVRADGPQDVNTVYDDVQEHNNDFMKEIVKFFETRLPLYMIKMEAEEMGATVEES